jgi:ribosomal protein S13
MIGSATGVPAEIGQSTWHAFLVWIELHRIGDLASIAGVAIAVIGFIATLVGVYKSKNAAQRAEAAARSVRDSIRLLDTVVDFSAAITTLEEIKRLHRANQWAMLPDRYASLRKLLVMLRTTNADLSEGQRVVLQNALANLYALETAVERGLRNNSILNPVKFNAVISGDLDHLIAALAEVKAASTGA